MKCELLPEMIIGRGEVKGFLFRMIARGKNSFIFGVNRYGKDTCEFTHYEVFKKKLVSKRDGLEYKETYPKANSFGSWALTADSESRAYELFEAYEDSAPLKIPELKAYGG